MLDIEAMKAENAERRKRKEAASKGPWEREPGRRTSSHGIYDSDCRCIFLIWRGEHPSVPQAERMANGDFIAAARNDPVEETVESLIAELESIRNSCPCNCHRPECFDVMPTLKKHAHCGECITELLEEAEQMGDAAMEKLQELLDDKHKAEVERLTADNAYLLAFVKKHTGHMSRRRVLQEDHPGKSLLESMRAQGRKNFELQKRVQQAEQRVLALMAENAELKGSK